MWQESFWGNYDIQQTQEGIKEINISSFSDSESQIRNAYLRNQDKEWARKLAIKQVNENQSLIENIESQVLNEARENLDKEVMINEAKIMLYEKLWISEKISDNSWGENFSKWLVDTLILDNYDLAIQVWETTSKVDEILPKKELDIEELVKRSVDIERQVKWLEQLWIPENFSRDLLESGLLNKKFLWWDLLRRFEAFQNKWIYYNTMIDNVIEDIPNLTREEVLLIFSYTDEILYRNLNWYMRWIWEIVNNMTPKNIEVANRLISKLEQAINKMPNLTPWDDWFILRGDKSRWWQWNIWDEIELKSFTSVSNNRRDIFLWWKFNNDTQISIIWKEWRVKDISSISIAVNFGDILKQLGKRTNEWVILPNSRVKILDTLEFDNINYIDVEQTK